MRQDLDELECHLSAERPVPWEAAQQGHVDGCWLIRSMVGTLHAGALLHPEVAAVAAILGTGFIHAVEALDAFGEATYKGLLFIANGAGAVVAAVGVYRNRRELGLVLGLLVAGGAFLAYVASRTVGLPDCRLSPTPGSSRWVSHRSCARGSSSSFLSCRRRDGPTHRRTRPS